MFIQTFSGKNSKFQTTVTHELLVVDTSFFHQIVKTSILIICCKSAQTPDPFFRLGAAAHLARNYVGRHVTMATRFRQEVIASEERCQASLQSRFIGGNLATTGMVLSGRAI